MADYSVVVPAHNEEAVISRCLSAMFSEARRDEIEVVVVCNGCNDRTAQMARAVHPQVRVIELPKPSKANALNTGDQVSTAWPRFYVDADVEVTTRALRATAAALRGDLALVAAPAPDFVLRGRPWYIRSFYRTWRKLPYVREGLVGAGFYGLSREGRALFRDFPEVTADDLYVQGLFPPHARRSPAGASFKIHTPRTLRGLLAIRTRVYRGNAELHAIGSAGSMAPGVAPSVGPALARLVARRPWRVADVTVYLGVNVLAKVRARRAQGSARAVWERDDSSRRR